MTIIRLTSQILQRLRMSGRISVPSLENRTGKRRWAFGDINNRENDHGGPEQGVVSGQRLADPKVQVL